MKQGKNVCHVLKTIRKQIADANNIFYRPTPCHFKGECSGTCPACEAEVRYIEYELNMRQIAGKAITVAGISVGLAALTACSNQAVKPIKKVNHQIEATGMVKTPPQDDGFKQGEVETRVRATVKFTPPVISDTNKKAKTVTVTKSAQKANTVPIIVGKVCEPSDTYEYEKMNDPNYVFKNVEQMPSFPGGVSALMKYINENVEYPPTCIDSDIQGRIIVRFIVERDGSLSNIQIARSLDPALDSVALKLVKGMPKWTPGHQKGKEVRVAYSVPVTFRLE